MIYKIIKFDIKALYTDIKRYINNIVFLMVTIVGSYIGFGADIADNHFLASSLMIIMMLLVMHINNNLFKDDLDQGVLAQYLLANIEMGSVVMAKFCLVFLLALPVVLITDLGLFFLGLSPTEILFTLVVQLAIIPALITIILLQAIYVVKEKLLVGLMLTIPLAIFCISLSLFSLEAYFLGTIKMYWSYIKYIIFVQMVSLPVLFLIMRANLTSLIKAK